MSKPIHYEKHPVSPARKAEIVAAGFRIVDLRFAPDDWTSEQETEASTIPECADDVDSMGKDDLRDLLKAHGVTPAGRSGAKAMREQLKAVMFMGDE